MPDLDWIRTTHGEICTQGGHVTRWSGGGGDILFLSRESRFAPGQAIRGGIPVIFPWFGDDPEGRGRSAHGFARRLPWRVLDESREAGESRCRLALEDDERTRVLWPHAFELTLDVSFGDTLALALTVTNRDAAPFRCEIALHTYLTVGDVRRIRVRGLERTPYIDKVDGFRHKEEGDAPVGLTGETDRVYTGTTTTCVVEDPMRGRAIEIAKEGSRSTILWNPWQDKTAGMSDLADDEWASFVCVESANVGEDAVVLPPGGSRVMRVSVSATETRKPDARNDQVDR